LNENFNSAFFFLCILYITKSTTLYPVLASNSATPQSYFPTLAFPHHLFGRFVGHIAEKPQ